MPNKAAFDQYNATQRRKSLEDPAWPLAITNSLEQNSGFDPTITFPSGALSRDVTISVILKRTAANPVGIIVEVGGATRGLALWVPAASTNGLGFAFGQSGNDGGFMTVDNVFPSDTLQVKIVAAVSPRNGEGRVWANGRRVMRINSVNGDLNTAWASSESGDVGNANGNVHPDVPIGDDISLSNIDILGKVHFHIGQLPLQFNS